MRTAPMRARGTMFPQKRYALSDGGVDAVTPKHHERHKSEKKDGLPLYISGISLGVIDTSVQCIFL